MIHLEILSFCILWAHLNLENNQRYSEACLVISPGNKYEQVGMFIDFFSEDDSLKCIKL